MSDLISAEKAFDRVEKLYLFSMMKVLDMGIIYIIDCSAMLLRGQNMHR